MLNYLHNQKKQKTNKQKQTNKQTKQKQKQKQKTSHHFTVVECMFCVHLLDTKLFCYRNKIFINVIYGISLKICVFCISLQKIAILAISRFVFFKTMRAVFFSNKPISDFLQIWHRG